MFRNRLIKLIKPRPYFLFRHFRLTHGIRVAAAVATSMLLTLCFHIPHGEWMSITVIVVMGSLPHLGSVTKKGWQRVSGTLIGAVAGLIAIVLHHFSPYLSFIWMVVCAGLCGYNAIGKAGYTALLTGISLMVVAGVGDHQTMVGLLRSANVIAGTGIAFIFIRIFPQKAELHWRFSLSDNLRDAAKLYLKILSGQLIKGEDIEAAFEPLHKSLLKQRGLMVAVNRETKMPMDLMERIQRNQRALIADLELMAETIAFRITKCERERLSQQIDQNQRIIPLVLRGMAHALRFNRPQRLVLFDLPSAESVMQNIPTEDSFECRGVLWMNHKLLTQIHRLDDYVTQTFACWLDRKTLPALSAPYDDKISN